MPQISYGWAILVTLYFYTTNGLVVEPFVIAMIGIALWNALPEFWEDVGFVNKKSHKDLLAKVSHYEDKIESLEKELDEALTFNYQRQDILKTKTLMKGQDSVFYAYVHDRLLFEKHLRLYKQSKGYNDPPKKYQKEDWRKTLGVSETASKQEVADAYRNLVKVYHPDGNKEGSKDKLVAINLAKEEADKYFA